MTELHDLTANQVVDGIAGREFSAVEVVQALLKRIDQLEPELQAWAKLDPEGALAQARRCEVEVATGRKPARLAGLPLGIKDVFYTAGLETVANSPLLVGHVPTEDAGAVAALRADGAIVLGKTVTTQFADGDPAVTRNPWNADRTPGGSSSGSAAAVAARMVPAALGTQTAGSVLRPSRLLRRGRPQADVRSNQPPQCPALRLVARHHGHHRPRCPRRGDGAAGAGHSRSVGRRLSAAAVRALSRRCQPAPGPEARTGAGVP